MLYCEILFKLIIYAFIYFKCNKIVNVIYSCDGKMENQNCQQSLLPHFLLIFLWKLLFFKHKIQKNSICFKYKFVEIKISLKKKYIYIYIYIYISATVRAYAKNLQAAFPV